MVDFIAPWRVRVQKQRKIYQAELFVMLVVLLSYCIWQYLTLPAALTPAELRQLRVGYQQPPALMPHPLFSQLQLLNNLGLHLQSIEGNAGNLYPDREPQLQLHRVHFEQEKAQLTLFMQSAQSLHQITNWQAPAWDISAIEMEELMQQPPYEWQVTVALTPKPILQSADLNLESK